MQQFIENCEDTMTVKVQPVACPAGQVTVVGVKADTKAVLSGRLVLTVFTVVLYGIRLEAVWALALIAPATRMSTAVSLTTFIMHLLK
jgi:hypothetical protein